MDLNWKRAKREKAIALEVVNELFAVFKPQFDAAMDAGETGEAILVDNQPQFAHIFGMACERNGLQTEEECRRVFGYIGPTVKSLDHRFKKLARKVEKGRIDAERMAARGWR